MGTRELSKERTRRAIESAAIGLYRAKGPSSTTVDDICARAGVGRRTFFRYFNTKEDVLTSRLRIDEQVVSSAFLDAQVDEELLTTLLRSVQAVLSDQEGFRDFVDVMFGSSELRTMLLGMLADFEDKLALVLSERFNTDEDMRIAAAVAVCGFRVGLQSWLRRPGSTDPYPDVERAIILSLTGVLPDPAMRR